MTGTLDNDTPFLFYCDMSALSPKQRAAHQKLIGQLFGSLVQERRELADGFGYRFEGEHYSLLSTFISHERMCCPFLTFHLEVAAHRGPVWLELTAPGDVKQFLLEELRQYGLQQ